MKDSFKYAALAVLFVAFTATTLGAPTSAFARGGDDDDDHYEYRNDHDDEEDEEDDDNEDDDLDRDDDDDDSDSNDDELEIEADVFTDTTIVKVEREGGRKVLFATTADTRDEVVEVVAERFNLTEAEVDAALDFELEDRASRAKDRKGLNRTVPTIPVDRCEDGVNDTLQIEADVFTDTTIVKVERPNSTDVIFETEATTSSAVVDAVAERFTSLTTSEISAALDFEIEDRASRASDFTIDNREDCDDSRDDSVDSDERIVELRARVAELQTLLERLIALLRGSGN